MSDFLTGVKIFITTIVTTVSTLVTPAASVPAASPNPALNPEFVKLASKSAAINTPLPTPSISQDSPKPQSTPLTLNEENYIYIQGTYSYLGQSIKYLALVPRKGGNFQAAISGACEAQAAGDYEGGNEGKISGNASGSCKMFGVKLQGSTKFGGKLYPEEKTIELDIENSPIHGYKIKYD